MAIIGRIRKHSAIAVTVIALAIVAFVIGDVFNKQQRGGINVGRIDGNDISYMEFEDKVHQQEDYYRRQTQKLQVTNEELYMLRDNAWNQILQERLLAKEFNTLGLSVSKAELSDMFLGTFIHPALLQAFTDPSTGEYNRFAVAQRIDDFDNFTNEEKIEWSNYEKAVKEDRLNTKYNNLIAQGFYTPTAIANIIVKLQSQTVDTRYVVANYASIPESEVIVSEDDYKKYYDAHKEMFKQSSDSRSLDYVVFQINPTSEDLMNIQNNVYSIFEELKEIDNKEIPVLVNSESDTRYDSIFRTAEYFGSPFDSIVRNSTAGTLIDPVMLNNQWQMGKVLKVENRPDSVKLSTIFILNNKQQGVTRTQEEAKALADSLLNILQNVPFLFSQFVQTYSDDPQRAENMGDMGWIPDGAYNEEMLNTNTMGVYVSEYPNGGGYMINQIAAKTEYKKKYRVAMITRDIEASDRTIKDVYARTSKFASESQSLDALRENAQKEGLMVRSADMVTEMDSRLPGLSSAREIVRWAFNKDTKIGNVGTEIFESEGMYIIAALKDIRPKGYVALAQVKPMIEQQVKAEKRAELMMEKVKKVVSGTQDINSIASQLNAIVDTITGTGFGDYYFGRNGAEMKVLGSLANAKPNTLVGPVKGNNGVYVIYIDNVAQGIMSDPRMYTQQMDMMNQQKAMMATQVLIENANVKDTRGFWY